MNKPRRGYKKVKWLFGKEIEIPEEWELIHIHNIARINPEQIKDDYKFDEIDYIDISSIDDFQISKLEKFQLDKRPSRAQRIVKIGDVIIALVRPYLKAFSLVSIDQSNLICSTGFAVLRSNSDFHPHFLFNYCQSHYFYENYFRKMEGLAYPAITSTVVSDSFIPFPPLLEQQRIASILSGIDACIEATQKTIKKTERLKKGLMQQLLTQGIGHKKFKKVKWLFGKEIRIPEEWYIFSLTSKDVLTLSSGESITDIKLQGKYPVYGSNGIIGYVEEYNEEDAILIGRVGASGSIHHVDQKVWVTDNVLIAKIGKKLGKKFCYYALKHLKLERFATKSAQPLLTQSTLKIAKMNVPPLEEQTRIASILSGVDAIRNLCLLAKTRARLAMFLIFLRLVLI